METKSFIPVWHPTEAKNYFTLYNNVNKTNQIVYYDTTNAFINYPKTFYYERTNDSYGLQLYKVETNSNSDNATFGANSTSTKGNFNINKIAPNNGATEPSIDLYVVGTIQTQVSWDSDYPSGVGYWSYEASCSPSTFPSSGNITINYMYTDRYVETDYNYYGDTVQITSSWTTVVKTIYQANGSVSYPAPTELIIKSESQVPSIYVNNWVGSGYNPPSPSDSWDAIAVGEHATYDERTGYFISLFNGVAVYVDGVSGDSRHGSWSVWADDDWPIPEERGYQITVSAWIPKGWISPSDNPN